MPARLPCKAAQAPASVRTSGPKKGEAALVCIHVFVQDSGGTHWHLFDPPARAASSKGNCRVVTWITLCDECQALPGRAADKADKLLVLAEDADIHVFGAGVPC